MHVDKMQIRPDVTLIYNNSPILTLKGGGSKLCSVFAFSDLFHSPNCHFTLNLLKYGLKMIGYQFSSKF